MVATPSGMAIEVSEEQSENALVPMVVTPSGMVTDVSEVQPPNAVSPMVVTVSGTSKRVAVLPIAYWISVLPSLLYRFPSID